MVKSFVIIVLFYVRKIVEKYFPKICRKPMYVFYINSMQKSQSSSLIPILITFFIYQTFFFLYLKKTLLYP